MKEKRTKYLHLRITEDEYTELKEKSASFASVSQFIRYAVSECSSTDTRQRIKVMKELSAFYQSWHDHLFHIGGNLNQSVKRANELSVSGLLSPSYIKEVLMPEILNTENTLSKIRKDLEKITQSTTKP